LIKVLLNKNSIKLSASKPIKYKGEFESSIVSLISTPANSHVFDLDFLPKYKLWKYNNRFQYISSGECLGLWSEKGIERLIENLASNAIKYGQPNTDIIVTLDNTGTEILFSIRNEGLFILLKDQTKFFNLFERSIVGTDKIGWGVGLKVVEAMVSAHKGSIEVESIEGKGTTFIVKFPKLSTLKIQ
jgi:signal transduction histidine kinase